MIPVAKRPYLGPRVRGLRIKELPRDKFLALAYANTLEEFLNILKTTTYRVTLEKLTKENIVELRNALIDTYLERVKSIYMSGDSEVKEVTISSLKFFEYENIRNLSIAIRSGRNPEDFIFWKPLEFTRRRHVIASLLGAKNVEEVGERLKQIKHLAYRAFELAAKYGEDKLSIFIDRQWIEDLSKTPTARRDATYSKFIEEVKEYVNTLIAIRARLWDIGEEVNELIIGTPTPITSSAVRDPPARFLENATYTPWGKILLDAVAAAPTLENIAIAMDNIYPAYMRRLADIYIMRFTEFSLGALAARLEYMRAEVMAIVRAASLIAEGVTLEKRRRFFEALAKL